MIKLLEYDNYYWKRYPEQFLKIVLIKQQSVLLHRKLYSYVTEFPEIVAWINQSVHALDDPFYTLTTKIVWIFTGKVDFNVCEHEHCNNKIGVMKNIRFGHRYYKYCSRKCQNSSQSHISAVKHTKKCLYGSSSYVNAEKMQRTKFERYGSSSYVNPEKARNTCIETYGVVNSFCIPEVKEHIKQVKFERYGDEHYRNDEKIRQTNKIKYGVEYVWSNAEVRQKGYQTQMDRYGCINNPQKTKQTKLERYGDENYVNVEKISNTCTERYGVSNIMQLDSTKEKAKQTSMLKYGTEHPVQSDVVKQKTMLTNQQRYHCDYPQQNPAIRRKSCLKYEYDNEKFDSLPELAYYVWLKDNNVQFEFHPDISIQYEFLGKRHFYLPDFLVEGQLVEIKGDQFFSKDGKMICFYRDPSWTEEKYAEMCEMYEVKHQCMLKNNVKIIRSSECKQYLKHLKQKFGSNAFSMFKISEKEQNIDR